MSAIQLSKLVAPCYNEVHKEIKQGQYTHYWFYGGRASTKSSFISIEIVLNLIKNPNMHAICFRQVADTLEGSVYNQISWAINALGLKEYFKELKSPLKMIYLPTKQEIIFRGLDDPMKLKSIKPKFGYFGISWFEELDEFHGMEAVRKVEQSLMRGGSNYICFKSYNPPPNVNSWVNKEVLFDRDDRRLLKTTYLDVPKEWLGEQFFIEAEHVKKTNDLAYRHEYLGEITGTGGLVYPNVRHETITDKQIANFDNIKEGVDWGYVTDPFCWGQMHYDKTRRTLYIYDEIYKHQLSNARAVELIKPRTKTIIIADSAEPKSISEFNELGLKTRGATKGADSRRFGIKWLQSLDAIIIDKERCPKAFEEFSLYELERDKNGDFKDKYPDKNDHCLIAGTMINTLEGLKPIELITTNDFVFTRNGYKRVLSSGISDKNREVFKVVSSSGHSLIGTDNHKILTDKGFRDIVSLRYGDKLLIKKGELCQYQNYSSMIIENGEDIQTLKEVMIGTTLRADANTCITTFGKSITEQEKKDIISITKMGTLQTIILKTLSKFQLKTIVKSTLSQKKLCKRQEKDLKNSTILKSGTQVQRGENGTDNTQKITTLDILNMGKEFVKFVKVNLQKKLRHKNFAPIIAKVNTDAKRDLITLLKVANCAKPSLQQINTAIEDFVVGSVVTVEKQENLADLVYDLTIEDTPEFFANGILVHNCQDLTRYAMNDEIMNKTIKAVKGLKL